MSVLRTERDNLLVLGHWPCGLTSDIWCLTCCLSHVIVLIVIVVMLNAIWLFSVCKHRFLGQISVFKATSQNFNYNTHTHTYTQTLVMTQQHLCRIKAYSMPTCRTLIQLTGRPNSNSEKNLNQGSFSKSMSSGFKSNVWSKKQRGRIEVNREENNERKGEMQSALGPKYAARHGG